MEERRIGFAFCGSYCTYSQVMEALKAVTAEFVNVTPIVSEHSAVTDSRFGTAQCHLEEMEAICGKKVIQSIPEAEPIGPKGLFELLIVAPAGAGHQ